MQISALQVLIASADYLIETRSALCEKVICNVGFSYLQEFFPVIGFAL
jgi:hypothetical protein